MRFSADRDWLNSGYERNKKPQDKSVLHRQDGKHRSEHYKRMFALASKAHATNESPRGLGDK